MSKTTHDHHNQGQRDNSEGKYNPPHSHTEEFFTWNSDRLREIHDNNEAYRQGQRNSEDQKK